MTRSTEDIVADAWWALLVEGRAADVRVVVDTALERRPEDLADLAVIEGTKGWCGVYCARRTDPDEKLADAIRAPGRRDVIILNFGGDPDWVDDPYIARWTGVQWKREYHRDVVTFAEWLGVFEPPAKSRTRPFREAALVEGVPVKQAELRADSSTCFYENDRGVVILGDPSLASALKRLATCTYEVIHFLDNDDFACRIYSGNHIQKFEPHDPTDRGTGVEIISSVDGETDPRAIVRELGISEDYIFPPGYD